MLRIVVADSARARIYETARPGGALTELAGLENESARHHERDLGSDAPGRVFNRSSGARQTLTPKGSLRKLELARFARRIARETGAAVNRGECDDLALLAPPRLLSLIRSSLPVGARKRILIEIPKDFMHQPATVVRQALRSAGPGAGKH